MEISEMNMDAVLCYVSEGKAYFTTKLLKDQWGDDWNDAPYEHNAETPYKANESFTHFIDGKMAQGSDYTNGKPNWEIYCVHFDADLNEPCDGCTNSEYSVEMINKKVVPWLVAPGYNKKVLSISAGCPLSSFIELIQEYGGEVYAKCDALHESKDDNNVLDEVKDHE